MKMSLRHVMDGVYVCQVRKGAKDSKETEGGAEKRAGQGSKNLKREFMHSRQDHGPGKGYASTWFIKKILWGCVYVEEDQEEVACTDAQTLLQNALNMESGAIWPNVAQ